MGVALIAFGLEGVSFPSYHLQEGSWSFLEDHLLPYFRKQSGPPQSDDLAVARLRRGLHLMVVGPESFVHADLRLARIVETPGLPTFAQDIRVFRSR